MPSNNFIRDKPFNYVEPPNTSSTEGIKPSTTKETVPDMSEEEIRVLSHYAIKGKKVGILEPFEHTFNRLTSFIHTRIFQGLRSIEYDYYPIVSQKSTIFPTATIIGKVEVHDDASIWYNCVIKGDTNAVKIGSQTNIQDGTVILASPNRLGLDHDGSTIIGHRVTVGHNCILHACTVEDRVSIGMGSVLEDNSYMETMSQLGAGSVLKGGQRVKSGQLWVGNPARYVRDLTGVEIVALDESTLYYSQLAKEQVKDNETVFNRLNHVTRYHINV